MARKYSGPVVFVDGVHYPAKDGEHDATRPLRLADGGGWRDAEEGEPLHNDVNHQNDLELPVGGEG